MSAYIFDYEMTDHDTIALKNGELLYQIITDNACDALYIISTPEAVEDDARAGMMRKFGRRGPAMIERLEDITELLEYNGPGWYRIGFSDGGAWTNNGPIWIEDYNQFTNELEAARRLETETRLIYVEYAGDDEEAR